MKNVNADLLNVKADDADRNFIELTRNLFIQFLVSIKLSPVLRWEQQIIFQR